MWTVVDFTSGTISRYCGSSFFWLNCRYPRRRNRLILVLSPINNSCTRIFAQTMKGDTKHIHSTSFPLTGPLYGYNLSVHRLKWWFCTDLQYSSVVTASFRCSKANQPLFYSCSLRWDDLYSTARSNRALMIYKLNFMQSFPR